MSQALILGAAVAIGETRWNVAGLGGGSSNLAQVGGYASAQWNSFYLSAALAGAWHKAETERTITAIGLERLEADFDATVFGARIEGGWRYDIGRFGLIPHAAFQVQRVHTSAYGERATIGPGDFALNYAAQTLTDTRTELGFWADTEHALADGATLLLRARAAWMHDYDPESRVNAVFHGHAHRGTAEGRTSTGVPVYNVSMPLMARLNPDRPPYLVVELPLDDHVPDVGAAAPLSQPVVKTA